MFNLWKAIYDVLRNDTTLQSLMTATPNVRRKFQNKPLTLPQIVFHQMTPSGPLVEGTPLIEKLTFAITTFAETDTAVNNISRRINRVLHDASLTGADIHTYVCDWKGWLSDIFWDEESDAWRVDAEFRVVVRMTS